MLQLEMSGAPSISALEVLSVAGSGLSRAGHKMQNWLDKERISKILGSIPN